MELVDKHRKPHQRVAYTIQTNGTLLDEDWAIFFKENDFLVGLRAQDVDVNIWYASCDTSDSGPMDSAVRAVQTTIAKAGVIPVAETLNIRQPQTAEGEETKGTSGTGGASSTGDPKTT